MGASLSWLAIKGLDREEALSLAGLEAGPEIGAEFPDKLGVASLAGGWLLFVSSDMDDAFRKRFAPLTRLGPAVGCAVEEHVMFMESRGFQDGAELWRVTHNSEDSESVYHLEIKGEPPAALDMIRQEAIRAQDAEGGEDAGVDLISDVPLDLAKSVCGFRHDEDGPDDLNFTELRPVRAAASGGGLLGRLFGRK